MAEEEKKPWSSLGSADFVAKLNQLNGETVVVKVAGKDYTLPKAPLVYHSAFFDRAFNGPFKEAVDQTLELGECTQAAFTMVVQWIYTGSVVAPHGQPETIAEKLDLLIDFLMLADRIDLLGSVEGVVATLQAYIIADRSILKPKHIRSAASLPRNHPLRNLLAKACVRDYVYYVQPRSQYNYANASLKEFRFKKEVEELESFAADLLKAMYSMVKFDPRYQDRLSKDPLTGEIFKYEW